MKVSEFTKIMRKIIREEVRAAIKAELNEASKSKEPSSHEIINHGLNLHENVEKFDKKNYSKNSMLNEILNETANTTTNLGIGSNKDPETLEGAPFTSKDAVTGIRSKFAEAMNMDSDFGGKPTAQEMLPDDKKHVQVPDYIQNALTKDYSGLVKAMDKKK